MAEKCLFCGREPKEGELDTWAVCDHCLRDTCIASRKYLGVVLVNQQAIMEDAILAMDEQPQSVRRARLVHRLEVTKEALIDLVGE